MSITTTLNATDLMDQGTQLRFAQSAHQQLGMRTSAIQGIKDNAPAIVGAMRLGAALLPLAAVGVGIEDPSALEGALPFLSIHGAGLVGSELILLANGSKEKRQKVAQEYSGQPDAPDWRKPLNPERYPLESSAALDIVGEAAMILGGALMLGGFMTEGLADIFGLHTHGTDAELLAEDCVDHSRDLPEFAPRFVPPAFAETLDMPHNHVHCEDIAGATHDHSHNGGWAFILHGLVGMAAHLPIVFGKEGAHTHNLFSDELSEHSRSQKETKQSLTFAQSSSEQVGVVGQAFNVVKDNPIAVASALQAAVGVSLMVAFPASWSLMASGAIIAASAVLQGFLVRKTVEPVQPESKIQHVQHQAVITSDAELTRS